MRGKDVAVHEGGAMIKIKAVKEEGRERDKKRQRLLLLIGSRFSFHVTRKEAARLKKQLERFKL